LGIGIGKMKITKKQLKKIVQEHVVSTLNSILKEHDCGVSDAGYQKMDTRDQAEHNIEHHPGSGHHLKKDGPKVTEVVNNYLK